MSNQVRLVENLFSSEECLHLIERLEDSPLLQAERNGANYYRSVIFDNNLARVVQSRIMHLLPNDAIEVSDRFRFSKYVDGGKFSLHQDGIYQDPRSGRRSAYTISIFLNEEYEGGETVFYNGTTLDSAIPSLPITPKIGRAVIFPREVYHCGNEVKNGKKLLLRTDIMVGI